MSTSVEIRQRLKDKWPKLKNIWFTDSEYLLIEPEDLKFVLDTWKDQLKNFSFTQNIMECEEFALFFHAHAKKHQILTRRDKFNWCLGECITSKLLGFEGIHSCNLFLSGDKIYMVEPQTCAYWEANPEEDKVFFVKM